MTLRARQVRWVFDLSTWQPAFHELLHATSCIQNDDKERLARFVFREDFDASFIGRLLMRKFVSTVTGLPWNQIRFDRDERGKPFVSRDTVLKIPNDLYLDFNVSHQGSYSVLAGIVQTRIEGGVRSQTPKSSTPGVHIMLTSSSQQPQNQDLPNKMSPTDESPIIGPSNGLSFEAQNPLLEPQASLTKNSKIGIDIMKIEYTGGKPLDEFFRLMTRNFSGREWEYIKAGKSDRSKLAAFMRHWCLKESYVKNIGVGITVDLRSISFKVAENLKKGEVIISTTLEVDGVLQSNWRFEETLLDDDHIVAVALEDPHDEPFQDSYEVLDFLDLMAGSEALFEPDHDYTEAVMKKIHKSR